MNPKELSQEQLDLIERFIVAYNAVDHYLRAQLNEDNGTPFSQLIRDYAARYPRWEDQDRLRMFGDLRNALVHQRERSYEYLSVPIPWVVETLEQIRDRFLSPELVYPKFAREVKTFRAEDTLADVFHSITETDFSQYPVYRQGAYIGLLTENGITRWLAHHSVHVLTLVELEEVQIDQVLSREEQRKNDAFIARTTTAQDAENYFVQNPLLEALLITTAGKPGEKLLGIITRWDVLRI